MIVWSSVFLLIVASIQASSYEDVTTAVNVSRFSFTVFIPILPDCWCSCKPARIPRNETEFAEYVDKLKSAIQVELLLDTGKLSATTRKKISATDSRISAVGVGSIGILTLSLVFLTIACMDLTSLRMLGHMFKGNNV